MSEKNGLSNGKVLQAEDIVRQLTVKGQETKKPAYALRHPIKNRRDKADSNGRQWKQAAFTLRGVTIQGNLDLKYRVVDAPIDIKNCHFQGVSAHLRMIGRVARVGGFR